MTYQTFRKAPPNPLLPLSSYQPYAADCRESLPGLDQILAATRFQLVLIQEYEGPPGWYLGGRQEPTVLFFWLESGMAECRIGTNPKRMRINAGDLLIVPEGIFVDAWALPGERVPHACGRLTAKVMGGADLCTLIGLQGVFPGDSEIRQYIKSIAREQKLKPPGWKPGSDAAVTMMLMHLIRKYAGRLADPTRLSFKKLHCFQPVLALIEERFTDPELRVSDLARALSCSEVTLRQLCRETAGHSPGGLIRQRRIEQACILLSSTALPVKAIAEECGFSDPSFFCRTFRKTTGITADSYRQGCNSGTVS